MIIFPSVCVHFQCISDLFVSLFVPHIWFVFLLLSSFQLFFMFRLFVFSVVLCLFYILMPVVCTSVCLLIISCLFLPVCVHFQLISDQFESLLARCLFKRYFSGHLFPTLICFFVADCVHFVLLLHVFEDTFCFLLVVSLSHFASFHFSVCVKQTSQMSSFVSVSCEPFGSTPLQYVPSSG